MKLTDFICNTCSWTTFNGALIRQSALFSCCNLDKTLKNKVPIISCKHYLAAYLEEHLSGFQQYDDGIVRQLVERITVVDAETIRIKFRYSDVEIEQAMC